MNIYDEENLVNKSKDRHFQKNGEFVPLNSRSRVSVARRNARERRRIEQVNKAFDDLRKRVPCGDPYRKISKVETLRSAIEYIKALKEIVNKQKTSENLQTLQKPDEQNMEFDSTFWSVDLWNENNTFGISTGSNRAYVSHDVTCPSSMTLYDAEPKEKTCQVAEHYITKNYEIGNIQNQGHKDILFSDGLGLSECPHE